VGDNPLGGAGVMHLALGLAHSKCLRVLSIPRVGLGGVKGVKGLGFKISGCGSRV
jgi:hypothetical protein